MNTEKIRIINLYSFTKKDTGEVLACMTYSIKMQDSNNFKGSSVSTSFIPVEKIGDLYKYLDQVVDVKIVNSVGRNHQLTARIVEVANVKLTK